MKDCTDYLTNAFYHPGLQLNLLNSMQSETQMINILEYADLKWIIIIIIIYSPEIWPEFNWTTFTVSWSTVKEVEEPLQFQQLWLAELFLTHLTYFILLFSSSSFHALSFSPSPSERSIWLIRPFDPSILCCVIFEVPHCMSTSAGHATQKQTWNLDLAIKECDLILWHAELV